MPTGNSFRFVCAHARAHAYKINGENRNARVVLAAVAYNDKEMAGGMLRSGLSAILSWWLALVPALALALVSTLNMGGGALT